MGENVVAVVVAVVVCVVVSVVVGVVLPQRPALAGHVCGLMNEVHNSLAPLQGPTDPPEQPSQRTSVLQSRKEFSHVCGGAEALYGRQILVPPSKMHGPAPKEQRLGAHGVTDGADVGAAVGAVGCDDTVPAHAPGQKKTESVSEKILELLPPEWFGVNVLCKAATKRAHWRFQVHNMRLLTTSSSDLDNISWHEIQRGPGTEGEEYLRKQAPPLPPLSTRSTRSLAAWLREVLRRRTALLDTVE